jgi:serine/threonine protein kinase
VQVNLIDFGCACNSEDIEACLQVEGTPGYVDPVVLNGLPFTKASDIFSLGSVLFNLISGGILYAGSSFKEIMFAN